MPYHLLRGSIRKSLAMLIIGAALPALAFILTVGLQNRAKSIDGSHRELVEFARRAAESQSRGSTATRLMMENLSRVPDVRRLDVTVCARIFTNVMRINQQRYALVQLVGLDGNVIVSQGLGGERLVNPELFQAALGRGGFVVGGYQPGTGPDGPMIAFGCPVRDEGGQVRAVLLTSMLLSNYASQFREMWFPDNVFFGVCDARGIRLHNSPLRPEAPLGLPIRATVFERTRGGPGEGLFTDTGSDGVERLIAYRQLRLDPESPPYAYLFVGMPTALVQARAWGGLLRDLGMLLFVVALTLATGWLLGGRNLGRRLEDLAAAAGRIGAGDLSARVSAEPGVAEIDILADSFNRMAQDLEQDREKRRLAEAELRLSRNQAESASRAKSQFLANMSHEIRTPLNGVLGMLQLIRATPVEGDIPRYADMAMRAGQRLTSLLGDILDLSRIEAGRLLIESKPFRLEDLFTALAETFSPARHGKNITFAIQVAENVPQTLVGDELRLRQVLFNLIGNAVKFTDQGGVELDVSVLLPHPSGMARLLFMVSDTGLGIPDDKVGNICAPFAQVSEDLTRSNQGAGLGLTISQQLVSAMGGTLTFDSALGEGTTVYLMLPFQVAEAAQPVPAQPAADAAQAWSLRLLLVEDDEISRISARLALERMGHSVEIAVNGTEALQSLRHGRFDGVLMDVQMDVMDGVEATRRIRQGEAGDENSRIPVIAMTAYAMSGDRERFLAAGMDGYVSKPVAPGALRGALAILRPR